MCHFLVPDTHTCVPSLPEHLSHKSAVLKPKAFYIFIIAFFFLLILCSKTQKCPRCKEKNRLIVMPQFIKRGNVASSSFSLEQEAWLDKLSVLSSTDGIEILERTSKITGRSKKLF